jgi:hypothetical protein
MAAAQRQKVLVLYLSHSGLDARVGALGRHGPDRPDTG